MLRDKRWIILGAILWLIVLVGLWPSLMEPIWAALLLLLAALLLVPLAYRLSQPDQLDKKVVGDLFLPAAVALVVAFILPTGLLAALLVLPWLGLTTVLAFMSVIRLKKSGLLKTWAALAVDAGYIYLPVGGIWALLARLGVRPLGFSDDIVMLTAVHFHYAGFVLPILCGLAAKERPGKMATAAVLGVVIGVPLTAVGITLSQIGVGVGMETASAWITAGAGLFTAVLYFRLVRDGRYPLVVRVLWGVTAVALTLGMFLAVAYGSRRIISLEWLTIPWMRAVHGTANSIGFALTGLIGWWLHRLSISTANN